MSDETKLEVHEHCYISGPKTRAASYKFSHSHEGGNVAHQHEDTGPASFTIDKDDWYRQTGLRGGGRKKFTARPVGVQLPMRELEDWQKTFEVVLVDGPPPEEAEIGPRASAVRRMALGFGMDYTVRDERGPEWRRSARRARGGTP